MAPFRIGLAALVAASSCWSFGSGRDLPKSDIPFERYYQYPLLNGRSPAAPAMSPDGSKIVFGWNQTGERKLDVWLMDYPSGSKRRILEASKIDWLPRQDDTRTEQQKKEQELYDGGIAGFQWSPDGREILFNYRGRVWLMSPDGGNLRPLFATSDGAGNVQYSPDGKLISFMRGQNIYTVERRTGFVKQLTFLSKPNTSIDGYEWSPDGKWLAVTWSDSSKLGNHVMMDFTKDKAEVVNIRRMWQGEKSVNGQVGLVPADGGLVKWVTGIPRYQWTVDLDWAPDSGMFAVGWISEDFKEFTISVVPVSTFLKIDAYTEKAPKNYIPDFRNVAWSRDGERILFTTDIIDGKFANRSVMSVNWRGTDLKPVFAKDYDVAAMGRPKDSDRLILVTQEESPLESEIRILEPNGRETVHDMMEDGMATPKQFDDVALPLYSDDGRMIATLASNRTLNNELYAVEPRKARLTESQLPEFKMIQWAEHKEVTFPGPDGLPIHAVLISKPGLDKTKKHPAFISSMYANSGKQAWNGYFENYAAMELDMVVIQVDFRASWGYGGEFNSGYWESMGVVDAKEAVAAKEYLASLGYVDPKSIGLWGWSYGGFLTLMTLFTEPGHFDAGVAVAPVTDWKSYNEWYTRRRLGMASEAPKVYEATSPLYHTKGLSDDLLIVHGVLDDNVLFQDTARVIQKLIEDGKYFEMMAYPKDDHSIGRDESRPHVFKTIMNYLYDELTTDN